jgi:mannose-6-phosphate isomerase-like protein (cupin superfamily)
VTDSRIFQLETLLAEQRASGEPWLEFFRVPSLHAGLYVLAPGAWDHQTPHEEDEFYHVIGGRATFEAGDRRQPVAAGSLIYVAARQPHRFTDIEEELRVLVFFSR